VQVGSKEFGELKHRHSMKLFRLRRKGLKGTKVATRCPMEGKRWCRLSLKPKAPRRNPWARSTLGRFEAELDGRRL
jgi:hypothetical protein